jgi:hypothetical protein
MRLRGSPVIVRLIAAVVLALGATTAAIVTVETPALAATHNCGEPPVTYILNDGPGDIFSYACSWHDRCYYGGTHGQPFMGNRYACDQVFYSLMLAACDARASGLGWAGCWAQASTYYWGVRNFGWIYWWGNWWDNV